MRALSIACAAFALAHAAFAQDWAGTWFTTSGALVLERDGRAIRGTYGDDNTLEGEADGKVLTFTYRAGSTDGEGRFELAPSGHAFEGTWQTSRGNGTWRGWREDPAATRGRTAKFGGLWRTSWGLMELEQNGAKVSGAYGAQGWATVRGEVEGRRLTLRYRTPMGSGELWAELRDDAAFGGADGKRAWIARRLEGHTKNPKPKAGRIVAGVARNKLTYYLRAPKGYRAGRPAPAIVFFHGSNMSARPYVETIARARDFGSRFLVIGIDGERWQDWSDPDDPKHNYTYVNWMGKSTYQGYPYTDRESPALVAELIADLRRDLKLSKVLVGGHSQGGFLSYFMLMHFPDLVDGVFPISCGLVIQCEPDVFDDAKLRAAQRATPLAVVHGSRDPLVSFSQGQGSFRRFEEFEFPAIRMFDNAAGHGFSSLRFADAVEWLDRMTADDPAALIAFAQERLDADAFRDVMAVVARLRTMKLQRAQTEAVELLADRVDEYAVADAERFAAEIARNEDAAWVDEFLGFRAQFEFADAAAPAVAAYRKLRTTHEKPADELIGEARKLFREGQRDAGWRKYEEIVERYYASSGYRRVKGWLADRK